MEEPNFKVRRYSAEERRERIHRYRAKRTQRNFNKTIKVLLVLQKILIVDRFGQIMQVIFMNIGLN